MSETGKISEALADLKYWEITHAVWKIGNRLTGFDTKKDEIFAAIKGALPLAEKLEAEVVSLRAELERRSAHANNLTLEVNKLRAELAQAKATEIYMVETSRLNGEAYSTLAAAERNLRAQVEQLTADKARLDLLLDVKTRITQWRPPMNGHGWRLIVDGREVSEGVSQRGAIDAMKESQATRT